MLKLRNLILINRRAIYKKELTGIYYPDFKNIINHFKNVINKYEIVSLHILVRRSHISIGFYDGFQVLIFWDYDKECYSYRKLGGFKHHLYEKKIN